MSSSREAVKEKPTTQKRFEVPSVSDIKQAGKISSQLKPSLFKADTGRSTESLPPSSSNPETSYFHGRHDNTSRTSSSSSSKAKVDSSSDSIKTTGNAPPHPQTNVHSTSEVPVLKVAEQAETAKGPPVATDGSETSGAATRKPYNPRAILVNIVQKNNPVMKYIRNVPWELGNIVPDFELGRTVCAFFLSVRYHSLHPDYIHVRLKELGKQYELRILLVHVDTSESQHVLQDLAKMALLADLTLMLAWSPEEAARYLETYKAYENKPPDLIMERVDSDFSSRVIDSLTTVKKVNKTDAATLLNNFKTMEKLVKSSKDELTLCPGLGPQKAQRLYDLFHEPFLRAKKPKIDH